MPELPEIETIKLQLQQNLVGDKVSSIESLHLKSVQGDVKLVVGKGIVAVRRMGKMLIIDLEDGMHLAIHFKMSGQLILVRSSQFVVHSSKTIENRIVGGHPTLRQSSGQAYFQNRIVGGHPSEDWIGEFPGKHTRSIIRLVSGNVLYFNDQRIFGWVKILNSKSLKELKFIKNLGPEVWDMTDSQFYERLHTRRQAIKVVIMDQSIISGVGNIYANDGLWEAGMHPGKHAQILRYEDIKILRKSLIKVLREGIKYGGATASDAKFIDLRGLGGHYQDHFRTYDREGEKCLRKDGGTIKKITLGGRGTYYCPICQK